MLIKPKKIQCPVCKHYLKNYFEPFFGPSKGNIFDRCLNWICSRIFDYKTNWVCYYKCLTLKIRSPKEYHCYITTNKYRISISTFEDYRFAYVYTDPLAFHPHYDLPLTFEEILKIPNLNQYIDKWLLLK